MSGCELMGYQLASVVAPGVEECRDPSCDLAGVVSHVHHRDCTCGYAARFPALAHHGWCHLPDCPLYTDPPKPEPKPARGYQAGYDAGYKAGLRKGRQGRAPR